MIKHYKPVPLDETRMQRSMVDQIRPFITKGIADAREKIVLHPQRCDVKGAKRYNPQLCVIARGLTREFKCEAAAVGRTFAIVVINGLAIRMRLASSAKTLAEEFDQRGRARNAPIELLPMNRTWRLGTPQRGEKKPVKRNGPKRQRARKVGVRAFSGGVVH